MAALTAALARDVQAMKAGFSRIFGKATPEEIIAKAFDEAFYRQRHGDVIADGETGAAHYVRVGARRGFQPNDWFDTTFYMRAYPDVRNSGTNPLVHYVTGGKEEGRHASEAALLETAFDRDFYLKRYPDVAARGDDPIAHFLETGDGERRDPAPWFSTRDYYAATADARAQRAAPRTAFGYYLFMDGNVGPGVKRASTANPDFNELFAARGMEPATAQRMLTEIEVDVAGRLANGALAEAVTAAATLDPMVRWPRHNAVPFNVALAGANAIPMTAAFARVAKDLNNRRANTVVLAGADDPQGVSALVAGLATMNGADEVAVVFTAKRPTNGVTLPEGVRSADLSEQLAALNSGGAQEQYLFLSLRALDPNLIINAESSECWAMLRRHRDALADSARIFAHFAAPRLRPEGRETGCAITDFSDALSLTNGVITSSDALRETLVKRYALPPDLASRLHAVPALDTGAPDGAMIGSQLNDLMAKAAQ